MAGFLVVSLLFIMLIGGVFYGYCYLMARAEKISVVESIAKRLESIFG